MSNRSWFLQRHDSSAMRRWYSAMMIVSGLACLAIGTVGMSLWADQFQNDAERLETYAASLADGETPARVAALQVRRSAEAIKDEAGRYWLRIPPLAFGGLFLGCGLHSWAAQRQAARANA